MVMKKKKPYQNGNNHHSNASSINGDLKQLNVNGTCDSDKESTCSQPRSRTGSLAHKNNARSPVSDHNIATPNTLSSRCSSESLTDVCRNVSTCSAESQTESISQRDGLLQFLSLSEWDQVETLGELVSCLDVFKLRLLGSYVEAAARASASSVRSVDLRANDIGCITSSFASRMSYPAAVDYAYTNICLIQSTNRRASYALVEVVDRLIKDRESQLPLLPFDSQRACHESLGKLVAACVHHPALSVDQKIRLSKMRDELRAEYERINEPFLPKETPSCSMFYIRRFKASHSKETDLYLIEMTWNDGERTWAQRNKMEILSLHHRLLDIFGEEKREINGPDSNDSQSTVNSCMQPGSNSVRILPRLKSDAISSDIEFYINSLSDLPARMMLSSVIYEEFFASRQTSSEIHGNESRNSPAPSEVYKSPITAARTFVSVAPTLEYGPYGPITKLEVVNPTCSNCGGSHAFVHCDQKSLLESAKPTEIYQLNLGDVERGPQKTLLPPPGLSIPMLHPETTVAVFPQALLLHRHLFPPHPGAMVTPMPPQ